MSLLLTLLGAFSTIWKWISGNRDEKLGKTEQMNADIAQSNKLLKAELDAAANPVSSIDELSKHTF